MVDLENRGFGAMVFPLERSISAIFGHFLDPSHCLLISTTRIKQTEKGKFETPEFL